MGISDASVARGPILHGLAAPIPAWLSSLQAQDEMIAARGFDYRSNLTGAQSGQSPGEFRWHILSWYWTGIPPVLSTLVFGVLFRESGEKGTLLYLFQ